MKKSILIAFALTFLGIEASAEGLKVLRATGRRAIVEFPPEMIPVIGESYRIEGMIGRSAQLRKYLLAFTFEFSNYNISTGISQSILGLNTRFGWNLGHFEVGPIVGYRTFNLGEAATSETTLGLFADYNFNRNGPDASSVFGVGGSARFGQEQSSTGSGDSATASTNLIEIGPFIKLFGVNETVAVRGDLLYVSQESTTGDTNITKSGISLRGGMQVYF